MFKFDAQDYPYASKRHVVYAKNGMACVGNPSGASAGLQVLLKGGNAIDAAVAWQDEQIIEAEKTLADKLASEYGCEIITPDDTIREATIPYIQPLIEDWDLIQSMA